MCLGQRITVPRVVPLRTYYSDLLEAQLDGARRVNNTLVIVSNKTQQEHLMYDVQQFYPNFKILFVNDPIPTGSTAEAGVSGYIINDATVREYSSFDELYGTYVQLLHLVTPEGELITSKYMESPKVVIVYDDPFRLLYSIISSTAVEHQAELKIRIKDLIDSVTIVFCGREPLEFQALKLWLGEEEAIVTLSNTI